VTKVGLLTQRGAYPRKQETPMSRKPSYQELESKIVQLEKQNELLRAARPIPRRAISYPEQFRALVEALNDALVVSNENAKVMYVNGAFCKMLGYKTREVVGRPATDFIDESSHVSFFEELEKRRMGHASRSKKTFVAKDGRRIAAIVTGTPVVDEYGIFKGSFAVIKDITEQGRLLDELQGKTKAIEDGDVALRVLLEKRSQDNVVFGKRVMSNVKLLIEPHLEKLERSGLSETQKTYMALLKKNLGQIVSSFSFKLSDKYNGLTPAEIQVANLVKDGKSTKEISCLLCVSARTISFHRENIRRKLGLKERNKNLTTQLLSLE